MGIARSVKHGARGIHRFSGQEKGAGRIIQGRDFVVQTLRCLIERAPADNRGMRIVALQDFQPLRRISNARLLMVVRRASATATPVGELAPDQIAQTIRMIKESLFKDFLKEN